MLVTTTENVSGYRIADVKGEVFGVIVRSRGVGGNLVASVRTIFGGEIHEYTSMLEDARTDAVARMCEKAGKLGANAVVMMRFDASAIGETMSEIVAYGTAVVLEKLAG
jgi:uncharacterized protein YbjQ (UPF0145 family)